MRRTAGAFASRSTCRSPPGSAAGSSDAATALRLANAQLDEPFEPPRAPRARCRRSAPTFRSFSTTARNSVPATARHSSRSSFPQDFAVVLLLPEGRREGVDRGGLRGVRRARRGSGLRRAGGAPPRRNWPRSGSAIDLAALPPNDLADSPLEDRAPRGRRVPRGCQRCRARRLRPVRRACRRERRSPAAATLSARPGAPCPVWSDRLEAASVRDRRRRRAGNPRAGGARSSPWSPARTHVVVGARPAGPAIVLVARLAALATAPRASGRRRAAPGRHRRAPPAGAAPGVIGGRHRRAVEAEQIVVGQHRQP